MNYLIPGPNLGRLKAAVEAFKQLAVEMGRPIEITVLHREAIENDLGVLAERYTVSLTAQPPTAAGWTIGAAFKVVSGQTQLRHVPDQGVPETYLHARPVCDHCGADCGARSIFVLRNQHDGHCVQIWRDCLIDFLGQAGCAATAYAELLMSIDEALRTIEVSDLDTLKAVHYVYRLDKYLPVVAAVIESVGWVSRKQSEASGRPATADLALDVVLANRAIPISAEAQSTAQAALAWAKQLSTEDRNLDDYEQHLFEVTQHEFISAAECGLAASMISAHRRAAAQAVDRQFAGQPGRHIGRLKERGTFTLTVFETRTIGEGDNTKILHKFVDPNGNRAAWFAATGRALEVGKQYQIKATVVEHREFQGVPETILMRCTVLTPAAGQTPLGL